LAASTISGVTKSNDRLAALRSSATDHARAASARLPGRPPAVASEAPWCDAGTAPAAPGWASVIASANADADVRACAAASGDATP
jgi:hypothetical protein